MQEQEKKLKKLLKLVLEMAKPKLYNIEKEVDRRYKTMTMDGNDTQISDSH